LLTNSKIQKKNKETPRLPPSLAIPKIGEGKNPPYFISGGNKIE